jgi:hypothetical protein
MNVVELDPLIEFDFTMHGCSSDFSWFHSCVRRNEFISRPAGVGLMSYWPTCSDVNAAFCDIGLCFDITLNASNDGAIHTILLFLWMWFIVQYPKIKKKTFKFRDRGEGAGIDSQLTRQSKCSYLKTAGQPAPEMWNCHFGILNDGLSKEKNSNWMYFVIS